jgi:hypothetical protein
MEAEMTVPIDLERVQPEHVVDAVSGRPRAVVDALAAGTEPRR